jgi:hypothetical protein
MKHLANTNTKRFVADLRVAVKAANAE